MLMKLLGIIITFVVFLDTNVASAARAPREYGQADGGYLIYSVGSIGGGLDFWFPYKYDIPNSSNRASEWIGLISPTLGGMWYLRVMNPDFTGREAGHVVVRRLPPGHYSIENFGFGGQIPGIATYDWSSAVPFKIEFNIAPGRATYIGSFMRTVSLGTSLEAQLGAAGFFVIANRAERDLPIARQKMPQLPEINIAVTDVSIFGSAVLRNSEPE